MKKWYNSNISSILRKYDFGYEKSKKSMGVPDADLTVRTEYDRSYYDVYNVWRLARKAIRYAGNYRSAFYSGSAGRIHEHIQDGEEDIRTGKR